MSSRAPLILHRDDPGKSPLVGNIKVTRDDWLNVARDILVSDGVSEVKVLAIGDRLGVSRSSFYGYFKSRKALLGALLDDWGARNTATITRHCERPADTIGQGVCHFFRCFIDPELFDHGLDFAIREWARRDEGVRRLIDRADAERLAAVRALFTRHGYSDDEADIKARILYYMQLGYHALDVIEPMAERVARIRGYVEGFTGRPARAADIEALEAYAMTAGGR